MVIGSHVLTYKELVSAMTKCHKTIEVIRGVATGDPGPQFPDRPNRCLACLESGRVPPGRLAVVLLVGGVSGYGRSRVFPFGISPIVADYGRSAAINPKHRIFPAIFRPPTGLHYFAKYIAPQAVFTRRKPLPPNAKHQKTPGENGQRRCSRAFRQRKPEL